MSQHDPLYKLRHALAGVALALLLAIITASLVGRLLGDLFGGGYGARMAIYVVLLMYAVVGACVLFAKVAQHETRPLSFKRVALWFASLWVWPLLLRNGQARQP
jgi:Na+/citrate or Na+/malate symporter